MSNITDRMKARKSMGFCLQQNILYDSLTVGDHMRFIAKLREIPSDLVDINVCFLKFRRVPLKMNELRDSYALSAFPRISISIRMT